MASLRGPKNFMQPQQAVGRGPQVGGQNSYGGSTDQGYDPNSGGSEGTMPAPGGRYRPPAPGIQDIPPPATSGMMTNNPKAGQGAPTNPIAAQWRPNENSPWNTPGAGTSGYRPPNGNTGTSGYGPDGKPLPPIGGAGGSSNSGQRVNLPGFDPSRTDDDPKQVYGRFLQDWLASGKQWGAEGVKAFLASDPRWEGMDLDSDDPKIRVRQPELDKWKPGQSVWQDVIGDSGPGGQNRGQYQNVDGYGGGGGMPGQGGTMPGAYHPTSMPGRTFDGGGGTYAPGAQTNSGPGAQHLSPADPGFWVTLPSGQTVPYNHPLAQQAGGPAPTSGGQQEIAGRKLGPLVDRGGTASHEPQSYLPSPGGGTPGQGGQGSGSGSGSNYNQTIEDLIKQFTQQGGGGQPVNPDFGPAEDQSQNPLTGSLMEQLQKMLKEGGGANAEGVKLRTENARIGGDRMKKAQMDQARADLADRGLLSEGGIAQGGEFNSIEQINKNLAPYYAEAGNNAYLEEEKLADDRMNNALSNSTGLSIADQANKTERFKANTDRGLGAADVHLRNNQQGIDRFSAASRAATDSGRIGLDTELGRRNAGIDEGRLGLDTELGRGDLAYKNRGLDINDRLGNRGLDLDAAKIANDLALGKESNANNRYATDVNKGLGEGQLALGKLSENRAWNQFLASFGLDRDRLMYDMQNGDTQNLIQLLNLYLKGADQASNGYY